MTSLKNKEIYDVLGLMSGTSVDGLDIAHCIFQMLDGIWSFEIKETHHVSYDEVWLHRLREAIELSDEGVIDLSHSYGLWLGEQVKDFILLYNLAPEIVASHGHTTKHQPKDGITIQIGDGQTIANYCGITTISNFRSLDVSLGGQGAPLVPIGDRDLFGVFDFCLNLGGIANVSFDLNGERIAYDVGIANMGLNYLANQLGRPYDVSGDVARSGRLVIDLLNQLNGLDYYQLIYPKSTGYEWFRDEIIPILNNADSDIKDKLCTLSHHIADMISRDIFKYSEERSIRLLITGGGVKNTFLIEELSKRLSQIEIIIPDIKLVDYKEALIFAFLGVKRIRNETNCLCSVTGATQDSCGGIISHPN